MKDAKPFVRMNVGDLNKVLSSGEIKNTFETGTSHAGTTASGQIDTQRRREGEAFPFGIPKNAAGQDRPIYGYLSSGDGISEFRPKFLSGAGGVAIQFKDHVKEQSTFTIGDSLDHAVTLIPEGLGGGFTMNSTFRPQPLSKPSILAVPGGVAIEPTHTVFGKMTEADYEKEDFHPPPDVTSPSKSIEQFSRDYVEVQIHRPNGPLKLDAIEKITFTTKPGVALKKRLEKLKIPYTVATAEKKDFVEVLKQNPFHDETGAFSSQEKARQQELADKQTNPMAHPDFVMGGPGREGKNSKRYIAAYGEEFKAAPLPEGIKRGTPHECYGNASKLVMRNKDLTYAEGYAITPDVGSLTEA